MNLQQPPDAMLWTKYIHAHPTLQLNKICISYQVCSHITPGTKHTHSLYCFKKLDNFPINNAQQTQVSHVPNVVWVKIQPICLYGQDIHERHYVHPVVMTTTKTKRIRAT